jgi:hypothetical protein
MMLHLVPLGMNGRDWSEVGRRIAPYVYSLVVIPRVIRRPFESPLAAGSVSTTVDNYVHGEDPLRMIRPLTASPTHVLLAGYRVIG